MSTGRTIGLAFLGLLIGGVVGGGFGLIAGLAYTEFFATSGFEGYSGFVVAYWLAGGVVAGIIVGLVLALTRARK